MSRFFRNDTQNRHVRSFSATYLQETRTGLWEGSRSALAGLQLPSRQSILEVGAGTGAFTRVLREETGAKTGVIAVDRDRTLLPAARQYGDPVVGDATSLPFAADSVDLVVCQALLVNLRAPGQTLTDFMRVSSELVGAVEPDNEAVQIETTVNGEAKLATQARDAFLTGARTDPTLGRNLRELFAERGLTQIEQTRHEFTRTVEPPYSERALAAARRQATGTGLDADRETLLAGPLSTAEYDQLRSAWRTVGRKVIDQMQAGTYRRTETVPLYVTVGTVPRNN